MHYIYVIKNSINMCVYVGQTKNHLQRKATHWYCSRTSFKPLYVAMRELGVENFLFEVLEECVDPQTASEREKHWISHFDSFNHGYNLTRSGGFTVGNLGRKFSEEHKRKLSESNKKNWTDEDRKLVGEQSRAALTGRSLPQEHKDKISKNHSRHNKGKTLPEETREKIRKALLGRTLSEETKQKMSESRRKRKS